MENLKFVMARAYFRFENYSLQNVNRYRPIKKLGIHVAATQLQAPVENAPDHCRIVIIMRLMFSLCSLGGRRMRKWALHIQRWKVIRHAIKGGFIVSDYLG